MWVCTLYRISPIKCYKKWRKIINTYNEKPIGNNYQSMKNGKVPEEGYDMSNSQKRRYGGLL